MELAPDRRPRAGSPTIAQVLGLREVPGVPILDTLSGYLKNRHLLLIFDNCEHLLSACAFIWRRC